MTPYVHNTDLYMFVYLSGFWNPEASRQAQPYSSHPVQNLKVVKCECIKGFYSHRVCVYMFACV
jgi:hypothetical protein